MNSSIGRAHLEIFELPPLLGLGGAGKGAAGGGLVDLVLQGPVGVRRRHEVEHGAAQRRGRRVGARDDLERDLSFKLFAADTMSDEGALPNSRGSVNGHSERNCSTECLGIGDWDTVLTSMSRWSSAPFFNRLSTSSLANLLGVSLS